VSFVYDDLPTSFEEMYIDPRWSAEFYSWGEQRADWIGSLTRAVWAMRGWTGDLATARAIYIDLNRAAPPMDGAMVAALDPDMYADGTGNVATGFFDDAYVQALQWIGGTQDVYAQFYADHNQALADSSVSMQRATQSRPSMIRDEPVPEDERAQYVTRANVWIQPVRGDPQILASAEADEDYWFEASTEQLAAAAQANEQTLKRAEDGDTLTLWQWNDVIVIGDGRNAGELRQICADYGVQGTLTIEKGSTFSRGTLTITGAHDNDAVARHIAQFSQKTCYFE